jgi:hypothetical protein
MKSMKNSLYLMIMGCSLIYIACTPKEFDIGTSGTGSYICRLKYFVRENELGVPTDSIFPISEEDSITIVLAGNRFLIYSGNIEKCNLEILNRDYLSNGGNDLSCQNYEGAGFLELSSGDSVIFSFAFGGAIFHTLPSGNNVSGLNGCNTYGFFSRDYIEY